MKIFLSSTYEDLKDHRRAVRDAILRLGQQPIGMEDFGSRPEEWNTAALNAMDGCAALVGIYAHRYGSIPDGDTISISEQEFDKARNADIPCFCYRVDPKSAWDGDFKDAGEQAERLMRFMKRVDALLRSQFTTPEDLASKVAADLGRFFTTEAPMKIISPLHSLLTPPADFIGRTAEIEQLMRELTSGTRVAISGIAGMGGIGKTTLALAVAHKLVTQYPDAQIMIDLKGTSAARLTPADAMQRIIHSVEPQADLRYKSDDELAATYRTLFTDKRALLLLDNAANASQVKLLIPPLTCALLVTSRRHLILPGLQLLRLNLLPPEQAAEFLLRLCPRIGDFSNEIGRLCGYLPLALRIAGTTLSEQVELSPKEYIARLQNQNARLKLLRNEEDPDLNVEATFELSYELLSPEMQKLWRSLSVFPAPFDTSAAASVCAMDVDATRIVLSNLARRSLIERSPIQRSGFVTMLGDNWGLISSRKNFKDGQDLEDHYDFRTRQARTSVPNPFTDTLGTSRYHLHDLLSLFGSARLTATERTISYSRYAQHYLLVLQKADALCRDPNASWIEGFILLDTEYPHIQAGHTWATSNLETDGDALRLTNEYAKIGFDWGVTDTRIRRLGINNWISWLKTAIVAARTLGDKQGEMRHLARLGFAYDVVSDWHQSANSFEKALTMARELGERNVEDDCLRGLFNAYIELHDQEKMMDVLKTLTRC